MNSPFTIVLFVLAVLILLLFVIIRNRKDRKNFEEKMNQNYRKPKSGEVDNEGTDSI